MTPGKPVVLFDSGGTLARSTVGRWWPKPGFVELITGAGLTMPAGDVARAALDAGAAYLSDREVIHDLDEEVAVYVGCYRLVLDILFGGFPPGLDCTLAEVAVFELDQVLYEDTTWGLQELGAAGARLGIVSNAAPSLELRYRAMGIRHLFEVFVVSAVLGTEKPEAAIYEHALAEMAVAAEDAVFVDDVEGNVEAALRLGMTGYVIDRTGSTLRQPHLDYVTDLAELLRELGVGSPPRRDDFRVRRRSDW